jgi:hypothetical protein
MDSQSTNQLESQVEPFDSKRASLPAWVLWPTLSVLFYVLSIGPALKLSRSNFGWHPSVEGVYAPVFRACHLFPPAERCLYKYLYLCNVPMPLD